MKLRPEEKKHIERVLKKYLDNADVQKMQDFIQHGSVSTFEHCKSVTKVSYLLNKRLHLGANEKDLLTGAFLHDFYLYDWHDPTVKRQRLHGFFHPETARRNAKKRFAINKRVQKIISSHMWPLTLTKLPTNREAIIVCIADKYVSLIETVAKRKKKEKEKGNEKKHIILDKKNKETQTGTF